MRTIPTRIVAICLLGILVSMLSLAQGFCADDEFRLVQGIGYPPVKVGSKTQALLMARRAAVLDAYRNTVRTREEDREAITEWDLYEGFPAFVRGIILMDEALLADGGVQVTVKVPSGNLLLSDRKDAVAAKGPERKSEHYTGPIRVNEEEWYRIIEQMVRFDGKTRKKRE
jgi:hypothetical protein